MFDASKLLPWNWGKGRSEAASRREGGAPSTSGDVTEEAPTRPQRDFDWSGDWATEFVPAVDIHEVEGGVEITVELPGLEAGDFNVTVAPGQLAIRGEKEERFDRSEGKASWSELRYGSFERVLPLPRDVLAEDASASFEHGILHVRLARSEGASTRARRIEVESIPPA